MVTGIQHSETECVYHFVFRRKANEYVREAIAHNDDAFSNMRIAKNMQTTVEFLPDQ